MLCSLRFSGINNKHKYVSVTWGYVRQKIVFVKPTLNTNFSVKFIEFIKKRSVSRNLSIFSNRNQRLLGCPPSIAISLIPQLSYLNVNLYSRTTINCILSIRLFDASTHSY